MKTWTRDHIQNWNEALAINSNNGLTTFQFNLLSQTEKLLESLSLSYSKNLTTHIDNHTESSKEVKLITFQLEKPKGSIWIYHNMADFEVEGHHEIFEEWGYLSPDELIDSYIGSLKKLL